MTERLTDEARHADTERNRILNRTLTDLDSIINGHDPEVDTSINNMVWDRLDKMAVEIEALSYRRATPADDLRAYAREGIVHAVNNLMTHLETFHDSEEESREAGNLRHIVHHLEGVLLGMDDAALTEARAREAAAWEAGRVLCNEIGTVGASRHIWWAISQFRAAKPPDATAALTARLDAEWNAAIEAAAQDVEMHGASFGQVNPVEPCDVAGDIRALRRNPKEGV